MKKSHVLVVVFLAVLVGVFLIFQFDVFSQNDKVVQNDLKYSEETKIVIDLVQLYNLSLTEINQLHNNSELFTDRLMFNFDQDSVVITSSEKYGFAIWIMVKDSSDCKNPETLKRNLARFGIDQTKLGSLSGVPLGTKKESGDVLYCDSQAYLFSVESTCFVDKKVIVLGDKKTCKSNVRSVKDAVIDYIIEKI